MKHIIIGTAGHIDHGKTTLIKALTGIETDRLKEEKKRGITIELGFAHLTLSNGETVGIVDVPGHEKFIKNMLAGAGGVDMAMLVIAADEGVMPQTEEHLNILSLLNTKRGIVVLTKADAVEADWLELVVEDIKEQLSASFLANAPLHCVSAVTGQGIDGLKAEIEQMVQNIEARDLSTPFRLPIDRVFTIDGFGTVITGTQIEGQLTVGDTITVFPQQTDVKVKGIQVHGRSVAHSEAGQRVAVNLAHVKKSDIQRGETLAAVDSLFTTMILDVKLTLLNGISRPLTHRTRVRFYNGTSEVLGRIVILNHDQMAAGETAYAQLRLERTVALKAGDPFVLRYYSPLETIGGGVVLDINPIKHKRFDEQVIDALATKAIGSDIEILEQMIERYSRDLADVDFIALQMAKTKAQLSSLYHELVGDGLIVALTDRIYLHKHFVDQLSNRARDILNAYHAANPLSEGINKQELRSRLFGSRHAKQADQLLALLVRQHVIASSNQTVRAFDFSIEVDASTAALMLKVEDALIAAAFTPPDESELIERVGGANAGAVIDKLIADGKLVRVDQKLIYHAAVVEQAKCMIAESINADGRLTLAKFRDAIAASRKYAIALLEYFDRIRYTKKIDDYRILK